jgi:thiol-disulfide isomerase/thioredoxin
MLFNFDGNDNQSLLAKYKTFKKTVMGKEPVVFLIYADWCGHCNRLKPIWKDVTNNASEDANIVQLNDLALEFLSRNYPKQDFVEIINKNFRGFPHIGAVSEKTAVGYDLTVFEGQRDKDPLDRFIKDKTKVKKTVKDKAAKTAKSAKAIKPKSERVSKFLKSLGF